MSFKIGDKVRIKKHIPGSCSNNCPFFNANMKAMIGKVVVIKAFLPYSIPNLFLQCLQGTPSHRYRINEGFEWADCMFKSVKAPEENSEEEDSATTCNNCNEKLSKDSYNDPNDNLICEDCYIEFQTGRKNKLITVDRFVGVELETENGNRDELNLPCTFGIKEDGSLNDSGVEIVTPPSKDGALIKNIQLACKQLNQAGFEATEHCGLHVHIDLRDIKNNYIKLSRLLRTFYAIEDVIYAMLPESRLNNDYCQPMRNRHNFYDFYGRKISRNFDTTFYKVDDKKVFKFSKKIEKYINKRSKEFKHENLHIDYTLGMLPKRRIKK